MTQDTPPLLADRMGLTRGLSLLRRRLNRLRREYPSATASCLEDWLLDVANERGARVVTRNADRQWPCGIPPPSAVPDEDLIAAICQPQGLDRPQTLRVAAQMISAGRVEAGVLAQLAIREGAASVLRLLAEQALRVDPDHRVWRELRDALPLRYRPASPLIHWTRLAEPCPQRRTCRNDAWRLVT